MVSELHARKAALEAKLAEKNRELKILCIQEAELTGILPPECPLEPGESPPIFRRRVGTAFAFPENLINNNKPKFKEEDTISALELECQIQTGIAEAALGIANDVAATKAVRRKHRHLYQQSRRKLHELGSRLTMLRQTRNVLPKQRKKPRPPVDDESCVDGDLRHDAGISLSPPPAVHAGVSSRASWETQQQHHPHHEPLMRHSSTHDGLSHHRTGRHSQQPVAHLQVNRQGSGGYFGGYPSQYSTLATCAHPELERLESRRERLDQGVSAPGYWLRYEANETENAWFATTPRQMQRQAYHVRPATQDHQHLHPVRESRVPDRFTGSLDRRKAPVALHGGSSPSLEAWSVEEPDMQRSNVVHERISVPSYSHPLPARQNVPTPPVAETLLPGQTYPEYGLGLVRTQSPGQTYPEHGLGLVRTQSPGQTYPEHGLGLLRTQSPGQTYPEHGLGLVRTQSLGSVEALKKHKEKEWYETSLDAAPVPPPSPVRRGETGSDGGSNLSRSSSNVSSERRAHRLRHRETPPGREGFESVVPFECPKNHTVVQAGKLQPYREVTKPFEMADFYKYSTKFRKNENARPVSGRPNSVLLPPASGTAPVIHPRRAGPPLRGGPQAVDPAPQAADAKPQQKGVYQPLQPMACSPMDPNAPGAGGEGESVGETFSAEMIAWYQDKSLPRSATLV